MARSTAPLIVGLCPDSPAARADRDVASLFARVDERIAGELAGVPGVSLIGPRDFDLYPVADYYDPRRDQLGHIPYTPLFFAALGTILARRVHALLNPPHKVVVLDCDNTLWKGVVGEEGVDGHHDPAGLDGLAAVHGRSWRARGSCSACAARTTSPTCSRSSTGGRTWS